MPQQWRAGNDSGAPRPVHPARRVAPNPWTHPDYLAPQPAPPEPAPSAESRSSTFLQELFETLLLLVVVVVALRSVIQNTRVVSFSMLPTLHEGQYLLVNKLAYRLGEPERGDIVVFASPQEPEVILIKRVVGMPGETVSLQGSTVFVNGQRLEEPYLAAGDDGQLWGPLQLGPDQYLMLGDNRSRSNDSRSFGPVCRQDIIGEAWISIMPPGPLHDSSPVLVSSSRTG